MRIKDYTEQTTVSSDAYVPIDSTSTGVRKFNLKTKVLDVLVGLANGTGLDSNSVTLDKLSGATLLSLNDIDELFEDDEIVED